METNISIYLIFDRGFLGFKRKLKLIFIPLFPEGYITRQNVYVILKITYWFWVILWFENRFWKSPTDFEWFCDFENRFCDFGVIITIRNIICCQPDILTGLWRYTWFLTMIYPSFFPSIFSLYFRCIL